MSADSAALQINSGCYCWPIDRKAIIKEILAQNAAPDMADMLSQRAHYFANTSVFLSPEILGTMTEQIRAIEQVTKLPGYIKAVSERAPALFPDLQTPPKHMATKGVFMGYDFHITQDGPRLIEINSNAGGAFIVNMLEQAVQTSSGRFADAAADMFENEWALAGSSALLKTIAIVDLSPETQFHYPDMCLAKALLARRGLTVIITDPDNLTIQDERLYFENTPIDLVYNRLTDFDLTGTKSDVIRRAYESNAAVITPAPHHHALYADKRNLIMLSDQEALAGFGASPAQLAALKSIPLTALLTPETQASMWENRRKLFFKPQAGYGSRGAFRGAKLTKKVWSDIGLGGYIAQEMVAPPLRAVTVDGQKTALKFDVRVYTYDGAPLLLAARVYQGQTTNLRTAGGGLAPVIAVGECVPPRSRKISI